ncbi:MAG: hypothetical protein JST16_17475 [Bdellovibrionales bacterium]|nr:hypothetical protein [Bdellovibrionales bacterium]
MVELNAKFNLRYPDLIVNISDILEHQEEAEDPDLTAKILDEFFPFGIKITLSPKELFNAGAVRFFVTASDALPVINIKEKLMHLTVNVDFFVDLKNELNESTYAHWLGNGGGFSTPRLGFNVGDYVSDGGFLITPALHALKNTKT